MSEEIILTYTGRGNFLFNVPARDLTQADIEATGYSKEQILNSKLYVAVEAAAPVADPAPAEAAPAATETAAPAPEQSQPTEADQHQAEPAPVTDPQPEQAQPVETGAPAGQSTEAQPEESAAALADEQRQN